jgi:hypothetical protein
MRSSTSLALFASVFAIGGCTEPTEVVASKARVRVAHRRQGAALRRQRAREWLLSVCTVAP